MLCSGMQFTVTVLSADTAEGEEERRDVQIHLSGTEQVVLPNPPISRSSNRRCSGSSLKTAKTLGLTIPEPFPLRADTLAGSVSSASSGL
jgi:hypothetical protein